MLTLATSPTSKTTTQIPLPQATEQEVRTATPSPRRPGFWMTLLRALAACAV